VPLMQLLRIFELFSVIASASAAPGIRDASALDVAAAQGSICIGGCDAGKFQGADCTINGIKETGAACDASCCQRPPSPPSPAVSPSASPPPCSGVVMCGDGPTCTIPSLPNLCMCGTVKLGSDSCWTCTNDVFGPKCKAKSGGSNNGKKMCSCNGDVTYVDMKGSCPPCVKSSSSGSTSCFAKDSATACRVVGSTTTAETAYAACYHDAQPTAGALVLMAELTAGDRVLTMTTEGTLTTTHVIAVQHKAADTVAEILTLHASDETRLSLTADHALFIDGTLVAADDAKVGSTLMSAGGKAIAVERIAKGEGAIINPVTASGSLLASDGRGMPVLAASHPIWIAPFVLDSPTARAVVNLALGYVGDVDTLAQGVGVGLTKLAITLAVVWMAAKMRTASK